MGENGCCQLGVYYLLCGSLPSFIFRKNHKFLTMFYTINTAPNCLLPMYVFMLFNYFEQLPIVSNGLHGPLVLKTRSHFGIMSDGKILYF